MNPTPEQQSVIETFGLGQAVRAGAGCGKSTTLVAKCLLLLERNPHARFVAVSFTDKSAEDLKAKFAKAIPSFAELGNRSGYWVMTIHRLCRAIIREFPAEAGLVGDERILSESEAQLLWERALREFWFDELPEPLSQALERFSVRESRMELESLLLRLKRVEAFGALERMLASGDADTRALGLLGEFVLGRYAELKRRQGFMDFDDLERFAIQALRSPNVRQSYHRRFDLVVVDEFQDTNPVQSELVRLFARPDASNLCVVGDSKQSIYRFRDADVSLFEEVCSRLPSQHTLSLNFRSTPEIIHFANQVCEEAFEASKLRYDPLEPALGPLPGCESSVMELKVDDPASFAAFMRKKIDEGDRLDEIALLLRKIRGNEKWLLNLSQKGIPISVESGGFFWEDPRVHEMVSALKWWMDPANRLSGAVFLRAPWMRIPDSTLDAWSAEDPSFREPFFKSSHPIARRLDALRGRTQRPSEFLETLVQDEAVERELGLAYLGLWHRCEEWSLMGLSFEEIVRECQRAIDEGRRDKEYPSPQSGGRLRVLTVHGSKGLEFPTVILIDLQGKARAKAPSQLLWNRARGIFLARKDADGEKVEDETDLAEWKKTEKEEELAESKRVLYVALTRAMKRLLLVYPSKELEGIDRAQALEEDHWRAWIQTSKAHAQSAIDARLSDRVGKPVEPTEHEPLNEKPAILPHAYRRARHSVTEWLKLEQCERRFAWELLKQDAFSEEAQSVPQADEEVALQRFSGKDQNELGTAVHAALENRDFDELKRLEQAWGKIRFKSAPVEDWVRRSPFFDGSLVARRDFWTECAFEIPIGADVLVGSMDRLVKRDGVWHVIDFKVTRARKDPETLLKAYRQQLQWYAWALRKLEPSVQARQVRAWIIGFYPGGVTEVEVKLDEGIEGAGSDQAAREMTERAARVLLKGDGVPKPGAHCAYCRVNALCEFRETSPETPG